MEDIRWKQRFVDFEKAWFSSHEILSKKPSDVWNAAVRNIMIVSSENMLMSIILILKIILVKSENSK